MFPQSHLNFNNKNIIYLACHRKYISCTRKYSSCDKRCSLFFLWQEIYFLWQEILFYSREKFIVAHGVLFHSCHRKFFLLHKVYLLYEDLLLLLQLLFILCLPTVFFSCNKNYFSCETEQFSYEGWVLLGVSHFCAKCAGFIMKISCETLRFPGNLVPRFPMIIPPWGLMWHISKYGRMCMIWGCHVNWTWGWIMWFAFRGSILLKPNGNSTQSNS